MEIYIFYQCLICKTSSLKNKKKRFPPGSKNLLIWLFIIVFVGTGATCVYPLLGCKKNNWEFLASEVDETNFAIAEKNIQKNNMQEKIKGMHYFQRSNMQSFRFFPFLHAYAHGYFFLLQSKKFQEKQLYWNC